MTRRGITAWLALIMVVVAAAVAPGASAAPPTFERFDIDDTGVHEFLTEECGVEVTFHEEGFVIVRTFSDEGTGPVELVSISIGFTVTAGENTFTFRDVGADLIRVDPDGTAILMAIGQLPFRFTGVLMLDLETGEAILEPQHSLEGEIEEACAALTA
jgi:hypothetical protein